MNPHQLQLTLKYRTRNVPTRRFTFDYFAVEDASSNYTLHINGTAITNHNDFKKIVQEILASNGTRFSTRDRDHDSVDENCAEYSKGGWWYTTCDNDSFPTSTYRGLPRMKLFYMAIQRVDSLG